jgi:heat shock protein HslJ
MGRISLCAVIALVLMAGLLAGCAASVTPTASLQTLYDTSWMLSSLNDHDLVAGSTVELDFYPEDYLQGEAGCNSYGADYIAEGDRFRVMELRRTHSECDATKIRQQEEEYFQALTKIAAYRASQERLEFDDAQGRTILVFARVLPPSTGGVLPGSSWELTSLQGQTLLPGSRIKLEFGDQWFSGFSGCNYYGGSAESGASGASDGGALKILGISVTAIGCAEDIMTQEKAYLDAFVSSATYEVTGDRLKLRDATGRTILTYDREAECAAGPVNLPGTAWQLVSVDGRTPVQGSETALAFLDDKWFVEYSTCAAYISTYQAGGQDLRSGFSVLLGGVCRAQEGQGVTMLEMPRDACLVQGRFQISTASGQVFAYEPLPQTAQPALEGPTWSLLSMIRERQIEGEAASVPDPIPVLEGTKITLTLTGGKARGSAGCNTYYADYAAGTTLTFGPFAATEMACTTPEGAMEQEGRYLAALPAVTGYRIVGNLLWLQTDDDTSLVYLLEPFESQASLIP